MAGRIIKKFLLTSSGISNRSIDDALVELLGKPIAESNALCIPTSIYPSPNGAQGAYEFIRGVAKSPLSEDGAVEVISEGHGKLFSP